MRSGLSGGSGLRLRGWGASEGRDDRGGWLWWDDGDDNFFGSVMVDFGCGVTVYDDDIHDVDASRWRFG